MSNMDGMSDCRLPGWPPYYYGRSLDYEQFIRAMGTGDNYLRTSRLAQPAALVCGDVIATGEEVIGVRSGFNSIPLICLASEEGVRWVEIASRFPIALVSKGTLAVTGVARTEGFTLSDALWPGDVLATGDEVLTKPRRQADGLVSVWFTGGLKGHQIIIPVHVPFALLTDADAAPLAIREYAKRWWQEIGCLDEE